MSKSLSFFDGSPLFYGVGTESVTNYKNSACRSNVDGIYILINIKVTRYVKQHKSEFVWKVFHVVASARISDLFQHRAIQSL
jgi:hypothetical protein